MSQDWYLCVAKEDKVSVSFHSGLLVIDMFIASRCAPTFERASQPIKATRNNEFAVGGLRTLVFREHGSYRHNIVFRSPHVLGRRASKAVSPVAYAFGLF